MNQKFSVKKLLKTIFISILVTIFIGTTCLCVEGVSSYLWCLKIRDIVNNSKDLNEHNSLLESSIEYSNIFHQGVEKIRNDYEKNFGEEYSKTFPAEGIFLQMLVNGIGNMSIIHIYTYSALYGVILGTAIYIIIIQNAKKKQLFKELLIAIMILSLLILITNFVIQKLILKNLVGLDEYKKYYLYDNRTILQVLVIIFVIYIVNMIKQRSLVKKLNKELNNK